MRHLFVTMSAALAFLVSAAAFAADAGGNAGACKPLSQTDATNLAFLTDGVYNNSASTATVTCGTLRVSTASPTLLTVDYIDNSASGQIGCGARIWHWNNKSALWAVSRSSGVATMGNGSFQYLLPSGVVGYVELQCSIPPIAGGRMSIVRGFRLQ